MSTVAIGQAKTIEKLRSLGATDIVADKVGNKPFITFTAPNGKKVKISTRSKSSGTWQTSTRYGAHGTVQENESEFWVFVDLGREPVAFYIAPLSWVRNDIHLAHRAYLEKHGGHRAENDESEHHAISVKRIIEWQECWALMGL